MFPGTDNKPGVLPLNECARYPSMGCPYLAGQTPPWGPSVLAVLLGQWRELVQMAVT